MATMKDVARRAGLSVSCVSKYLNHPDSVLPATKEKIDEAIAYLLLFFISWFIYKKHSEKVGTGFFFGLCLTYIFTARFFIEYTKDIQEAFEADMLLNMGQLLSIPFIIVGVAILIYALRRPEVKDLGAVVSHANKMYDKEDKKNGKRSK